MHSTSNDGEQVLRGGFQFTHILVQGSKHEFKMLVHWNSSLSSNRVQNLSKTEFWFKPPLPTRIYSLKIGQLIMAAPILVNVVRNRYRNWRRAPMPCFILHLTSLLTLGLFSHFEIIANLRITDISHKILMIVFP